MQDTILMVKFTFDTSKKMLSEHWIQTRAVVVVILGMVTLCVPSLGVLASSVVKVAPPSVVNRMFTLAQLIGAAVVPATSQVTVWVEPPLYVTAVLGEVTANGPVLATVVTVLEASPVQPAVAKLSRTVTRKFMLRATEGNSSQRGLTLLNRSGRFGK